MGIVEAITAGFKLVTSIFTHATNRSALNNAPDVKDRAVKQDGVNADSETVENIAKRKTDELRNEASE